ncbi:hypothetical protein AB3M93_08435 [Novosphingobium panipatense]|uniref:Uncharacterized protein n=1 Tax=Novosphingobium panipatense TaxID=428991 RepID=A0ABY1Q3J4_9SPHN|nr:MULTISPECIES: hypothetical protein [Novosphingobium]SMP58067.1 hypothetical protein SAMN06296065_102411 [Novosphingobium panipatense]
MNKEALAKSLVEDMKSVLDRMQALGALFAPAHLDAAIEALSREYNLPPETSGSD